MLKSYLTADQIIYLIDRGNSIFKPAEMKKAIAISEKYGFTLTAIKQSNMQLFYKAINEKMNSLPQSDAFRFHYEQNLRTWGYRNTWPEITTEYMKHLKVYESEYLLLTSPKWDELYTFIVCELGYEGINTDGGVGIFINNKCDYAGFLEPYSKKNADPVALKNTTALMTTLDGLVSGLSNTEKAVLASVVQQYITAFDKPFDFDKLHNLLYKGQ
jgi:hypothetical protein